MAERSELDSAITVLCIGAMAWLDGMSTDVAEWQLEQIALQLPPQFVGDASFRKCAAVYIRERRNDDVSNLAIGGQA